MSNILKKVKEKPIIEYIIITCVFVIINILIAYKTGVLASGYHLTDDHEIININYYINNNGLFSALIKFVKDDFIWRYRPLYFIVRVFRTWIFKTNFFIWHLFIAIECGLYVGLSYVLARKMKTSIIPSLIFSFIYLIGTQDEIIWRLGPQENMGMFLLVLSFIFVYDYYEKKDKAFGVLSIITINLSFLYKESFLILAPSFILFLFYLYVRNDNNNSNIFVKLMNFIKEYKIFIIFVLLGFIIGLTIIYFVVGLLESGYAGIDTSYTLGEYIRITLNVFIRDLKDYWIIIALVIFIEIVFIIKSIIKKELNDNYWNKMLVAFVFFAYSLGIQAVLYAKSAMFDRYKLPLLWILYFVLFVLQNKKLSPVVNCILAVFVCVYIFVYSYNNGSFIKNDAKWYADNGRNTTELFTYVKDLENNDEGLIVLTDYYWYEDNESSSIYLQLQEEIDNVYYLDHDKEDDNYKKLYKPSDKRISIKDANVIITDENGIDNYDTNAYSIKQFGTYYLLINNR